MFAPEKETSGRIFVLTHNFATTLTETTTLNLCTLTTKLLLVASFQNCELKQEPAHCQPSYNKLTNSTVTEKIYIQPLQKCGVGIVQNL